MDWASWSRCGAGSAGGDLDLVPVHVLAGSVVLVALLRLEFSLRVAAGCTLIARAAALGVSALRVAAAGLEDLVVSTSTTLAELAASLARSVGDEAALSVVGLAKHSAFGPAITPWEAAHKSVFVGPFLPGDANGDARITDQPLGLRDGFTILWRRDAAVPGGAPAEIGETVVPKQDENAGAPPANPWLKARSRSKRSDGDFVVAMPKPRAGLGEHTKEVGVVIKVKRAGGEVVLFFFSIDLRRAIDSSCYFTGC